VSACQRKFHYHEFLKIIQTIICYASYLVDSEGRYSFTIGTQESAQWYKDGVISNQPEIRYRYGEKTTIVSLICPTSTTASFEVVGEGPVNVYLFLLAHKCACWNGCSGKLIIKWFTDSI